MAEENQSAIASLMYGESKTQEHARKALPILVSYAQEKKKIYYSDLAREIDWKDNRNIGEVLGVIGFALKELEQKNNSYIPPLQIIAINKKFGIPSGGIAQFLPNPEEFANAKPEKKEEIIKRTQDAVFKYNQWQTVIDEFGLEEAQNNFSNTDSPSECNEGAKTTITVDRYERDLKARNACIRFYGSYICQICKFDFEKVYGRIGEKFINVHHLRPLSSIGKEHKLNPQRDLIPVCPNCHEMLHRRKPEPYSPDELREILIQQQK